MAPESVQSVESLEGADSQAESTGTVTVHGHGRSSVTPDRAVASVTVWTRRKRMAEAFAEVAAGVARVETVAAEHDVPVASQSLQTHPGHDERGRPDGFECHHALRLACPGIGTASALLGALVEELGAGLRVDGVDLTPSDPAAGVAAAREAAYADALAAATHLAELAGAALGPALSVEVIEGRRAAPGGARFAVAASAELDAGLVPGEHDVAVHLLVRFALR